MASRRRNQRTLAQARADRRELERAIARELKRANRQKLIDLRNLVRQAKAHRKEMIARALEDCRAARPETLKHARARIAKEKAAARAYCAQLKAKAREARSEVARRRGELVAERNFQATMRRIERENKKRHLRLKRPGLARTARGESDDEVEANIPPELVYLWRRVKRQIHASDRRSRTEAFLQYAEEHPDEELAALEDRTDEVIRQLEARERQPMRNPKKKRKKNTRRKMVEGKGGKKVGAALAKERATVRRLRAELRETRGKRKKKNPQRPPGQWWRRCLRSVAAQKYARDPAAVCGAAWWKMPARERMRYVHRLERSGSARKRRAAVAIAKAERNHYERARKKNPGPTDAAARREYVKTHWGERGRGKVRELSAADPRHGTATELGELVSIVYLTKKEGDRELTEYEHDFEGPLPRLVYNRGGLLIAGGRYKVKEGGITG